MNLVARAGNVSVWHAHGGDFRVFAPNNEAGYYSLFWALAALHQLAPNEVIQLYEGEWI